jgi:sulfatase maturation enzyme AslB (radical SAM superfamily)
MNSKSPTYCRLIELALNLDMSGMVSPCSETNFWVYGEDNYPVNLLKDDLSNIWQNNKMLKDFIRSHNEGERHPNCKHCWDREDLGIKSIRQIFNESLKDVKPMKSQPRVIVIKPGNKCNNACRSCNEHTSSLWYKDAWRLRGGEKPFKIWLENFKPHKTAYKDNKKLEKLFAEWQENMVFWDLYGGEPLIIPLTYHIIDSAIELGFSQNQVIQIHTNGTVYDPELAEKFSKYKEVHFCISIDGLYKQNDYLRTGGDFNEILKNTIAYRDDFKKHKNINMWLRNSPSPLNVYGLGKWIDFFQNLDIAFGVDHMLSDEPHNDLRYLPTEIKQKVYDHLMYSRYKHTSHVERHLRPVISFMMSTPDDHDEKKDSFWIHNNKLDELRGESFKETFPDYYKLFEEYYAVK